MKNAKEFFLYDYNTSLFPMKTTKFLIENGYNRAIEFSRECLDSESSGAGFSPQIKAFASKRGYHLRRTIKLDPMAETFIYNLVFGNRKLFKDPDNEDCKHFGYRFDGSDEPISATLSYGGFRKAQSFYERKYQFSLSFDVASYFNSMRHHDLVEWFSRIGASQEDVMALDSFLEATAPGRSSECWPQGIYPTKMMGGDFLRIIEADIRLNSKARIRFLDDFVFFADTKSELIDDFFMVQKILGARGLSINSSKTSLRSQEDLDNESDTDPVRKRLLEKRQVAVQKAYTDDFDEAHNGVELDNEEQAYILNLLDCKSLSEDDAELVVSLARGCEKVVMGHLPALAIKYPHLAKSFWALARSISPTDTDIVLRILEKAAASEGLQEYQLIWLTEIASDLDRSGVNVSHPLMAFYNHRNATDLSRAKILELDVGDVWLRELRREHLSSGRSDWMVWASLFGSQDIISNISINNFHTIANSSNINKIIYDTIRNPETTDEN